jgi:hypothetical protein
MDVLGVVELGEPLDHAGEQQGREWRGVEHDFGDFFTPRDKAAGHPEARLELADGPAQHLLVLDLFFCEAQQRPQPGLVAVDVGPGPVHDQRDDVLLDEGEDVAIAVAPDLIEHPLIPVGEPADGLDTGDPFGQERLVEVEVPTLEAVVHRPGLCHRASEAGGIAVAVAHHGSPRRRR